MFFYSQELYVEMSFTVLNLFPGQPCKKSSLTLPPNEITIDMIAQVKKSPMHRLARLAKMAGTARDNFVNLGAYGSAGYGAEGDTVQTGLRWGNLMQGVGRSPGNGSGAGSTEEGENGTWIPSRPPLGPRTSNTSDESSIATTIPNEVHGLGRSSGSKRDKYSKTRNPIQCLNPTQLQPPSSVLKADALASAASDDLSDAQQKFADASRKSLQRMFRFEANDPDSESPPPFGAAPTELETIFGSSPSTPTSFPLIDDQPELRASIPGPSTTTAAAGSSSQNGSATTR